MDKEQLKAELQAYLDQKIEEMPVVKTAKEIIEDKGISKIVKSVNEDSTFSIDYPVTFKAKSKKGNRTREDYRPTDEQKELISETTLVDDEMGYTFRFQATNTKNAVDRSLQRLSNKALMSLAVQAVENKIPFLVASKSDCEDHTWKAINGFGFVYNAQVKDGGLFYDVYIPENNRTKDILDAIFSAQINKLSIGFSMSQMDLTCNSCKRAIVSSDCPHQPGEIDEKGNVVTTTIEDTKGNYEISGVAVPCQQQAHIERMGLPSGEYKSFSTKIDLSNLKYGTIKDDPLGRLAYEQSINELASIPSLTHLEQITQDLMPKALEIVKTNSDSDKINIGKNTIEDNNQMDENQIVKLDENDERLCKVAEQAKSQAVAEIKSLLDEVDAKNAEALKEVVSAIKALSDNLSVLTAVKSLEEKTDLVKELAEIKTAQAELKELLKVDMSVPGSKSLVDMADASCSKKNLSADADILANFME